jgi:hypothetical protein
LIQREKSNDRWTVGTVRLTVVPIRICCGETGYNSCETSHVVWRWRVQMGCWSVVARGLQCDETSQYQWNESSSSTNSSAEVFHLNSFRSSVTCDRVTVLKQPSDNILRIIDEFWIQFSSDFRSIFAPSSSGYSYSTFCFI